MGRNNPVKAERRGLGWSSLAKASALIVIVNLVALSIETLQLKSSLPKAVFSYESGGRKGEHELPDPIVPHRGHKKVLVTGGAGFIGSHVAEYLLKRGDDVVVIDEMNDYYDIRIKESNLRNLLYQYGDGKRFVMYKGDICNESLLRHIFEVEKPDWVCHLAARAGVRPSIQDPYVYLHSNIEGTTRLLDVSRQFGVRNFVYASSSSVYALSKSTAFSEQEPVDHPISPYASSKKSTELIAFTYHHLYGLNTTGLRFFTVYGPRGRPDMAPFKFVDRISRGLKIEQYGNGMTSRDYTFIEDIVDGVVRAIDRPYPYEIFNLGRGGSTKLGDFIHLIEDKVGKKANIKVMPPQDGDVPFTRANVDRATALLGYKPNISVAEGIEKMAAWHKSYLESISSEPRKKICFVTTQFVDSVERADRLGDARQTPESMRTEDFKFYAMTNLENLPCPGWERLVLTDVLKDYPSNYIRSRYPKFMAWQIPEIRDNCRAVFFGDGIFVPSAEGDEWRKLADQLANSEFGMMQLTHSISKGPLLELNQILRYKKASKEMIDKERAWLREQPGFMESATVYANCNFGYDPSNIWYQQASLVFWENYSKGGLTNRDQPIWAYVLGRLRFKPDFFGMWPVPRGTKFPWKQSGLMGFNGHRYGRRRH